MVTVLKLAWIFLKIGLIFFGGGYVLIPLLHRIMVDQYHWLALKEFLDGVALSQLTPGPLAMLATFTGFKAVGFVGALVATVFIFLPCTAFMLAISSRYEQFRSMELIRWIVLGGTGPGRAETGGGATPKPGKKSGLAMTYCCWTAPL